MTTATPDSQTLLNQIVVEFMREQRRKRRMRLLFRGLLCLAILIGLYEMLSDFAEEKTLKNNPHIGVIDISGEISEDGPANADDFTKSLDTAYKSKGLKALILRINSPGGSPVQADYMFNQIQYYRANFKDIPVYAVCADMCASAAYYIAAAATEIDANPSSLVGSIGVLYNGFGFTDTLQKVGASRRLYTAGKNKGFLDPFSPIDPQQITRLQNMLNEIHQVFIEKVKLGRGSKLALNDPDLFSGLFWTGTQAKKLGLIDGFSSAGELARNKIKIDHLVDYTIKQSVFDRVAKNMHAALLDPHALGLMKAITNPVKWS